MKEGALRLRIRRLCQWRTESGSKPEATILCITLLMSKLFPERNHLGLRQDFIIITL